jgi:uncharacterized protein
MKSTLAAAAFALVAPFAFAESATPGAGHWEGSITLPGQPLQIVVDLACDDKNSWKGTIAIPEQNLQGFPLSSIVVANGSVQFAMNGVPGEPKFDGKLAPGGQLISGNFTQGANAATFGMKRTGDAQFGAAIENTRVTKAFEGTWKGALDTGSGVLRLVLKLANGQDGAATGTLTSVDQGGAVIPIARITQKGSNLKLEVPTVGGTFSGDIDKDGTAITGLWAQGPAVLTLTFRRPAAAK